MEITFFINICHITCPLYSLSPSFYCLYDAVVFRIIGDAPLSLFKFFFMKFEH